MLRGVAGGCGWLIFEFKCIIERTVVLMYSSEERGNTEAQREGDNTNTILLQFRSRDEEAAVSSSMMIHHPTKIEGARAVQYLLISDCIVFRPSRCDRNDHTTVTAPLPVCSAKLSTVGPG